MILSSEGERKKTLGLPAAAPTSASREGTASVNYRWSAFILLALVATCHAAPNSSSRSPAEAPHQDIAKAKVEPGPPAPAPRPEPTADTAPSTDDASVSLSISVPVAPIELGHPLPLRVEFKNDGAETTTFREPPRTWELVLLVDPEGPGNTSQVSFGKLFYDDYGGLKRHTIEQAAEISLEPGEVYAFVEDVGSRWPQLFSPGAKALQVIDRRATLAAKSNVVSVQVVFTEASMPKLFEFAERPSSSTDPAHKSSEDGHVRETRQFAARWIAEIQPGFQLDPEAMNATALQQNSAAVARARALWAKQAGSPEIRAKMDAINRSAGQGTRRK